MGFGRIYSIFDVDKRRTVYCGQTVNRKDRVPHGSKMSSAWKKNKQRYKYVVEEEHEEITKDQLNEREVYYIMSFHRTFHDINSYGMNFDSGGKSNGKLSGETLLRYSLASKNKWSKKEYKNKMLKQRNSEEYKEMLSKKTKEAMSNPEVKKKVLDGRRDILKSSSYRKKLSTSIKHSMNKEEVKNKFKGKNNYRYNGDYVIPNKKFMLETFSSVSDAAKSSGLTRQLLYKYCKTHNEVIFKHDFLRVLEYLKIPTMVGYTPKDLGFSFKNKEE